MEPPAALRGVSKGTHVEIESAGAQHARQTTPCPVPSYAPTLAQQIAAGRGLDQLKQPEPARQRELERA